MKDFPVSIPSPLGREHRSQRKILFVNAGIRDFLSHRLHLAYRMREVGFEVHVAGPVELGIDKIIAEGFRFHPIPLRRKSANPAHEIRCLLALVNLYRKLKPSIVHQFMLKPSLYGGIAARVLDSGGAVSMITGFGHLTMAENLQARLLRIPVRWGLRFALGSENAVAMFQNPDDRELFVKSGIVRASDSCLIPGSGIDPAEFFPTPEPSGTPIVLLAGRMLWVKGVGEFVSAARILRKSGSTARFALAGQIDSGHPSDVSLQQLHAWETEGIVEWWGWHDDVPALVSSVTLCCLPSYREGLPRVLVEACAGGRAVVTTDTPGCREVVRHGLNGLLVPVGDSGALADAIQFLLENPRRRAEMARCGREVVMARFTRDRVITETLAVYNKLLDHNSE